MLAKLLKLKKNDISLVDSETIKTVVETNPIICSFDSPMQHRMARAFSEVVDYKQGDEVTILENGDVFFNLILSGVVQIWVGDSCLGLLTTGEWFGDQALSESEIAANMKVPHNVRVGASGAKVLRLSRKGWGDAIDRNEQTEQKGKKVKEEEERRDRVKLQKELDKLEASRLAAERANLKEFYESSEEEEEEEEEEEWLEDPESDLFVTRMTQRGREEDDDLDLSSAAAAREERGLGNFLNFSPIKKSTENNQEEEAEMEEEAEERLMYRQKSTFAPIELLSHHMKKAKAVGVGGGDHPHSKPGRTFKTLVDEASAIYSGPASPIRRPSNTSTTSSEKFGRDYSTSSMRSAASSAGGSGGGAGIVNYQGSSSNRMHLACITEYTHIKPFVNTKRMPNAVRKAKVDLREKMRVFGTV